MQRSLPYESFCLASLFATNFWSSLAFHGCTDAKPSCDIFWVGTPFTALVLAVSPALCPAFAKYQLNWVLSRLVGVGPQLVGVGLRLVGVGLRLAPARTGRMCCIRGFGCFYCQGFLRLSSLHGGDFRCLRG
ncbi:hypothetical protein PR003_g28973 [Phytophthora rubi]|uniref:Uncharacterized protein n=1 Tax=Phytophthora rubi TaxID=129364 RepID=A0A6A3IC00_9STRA|nr:hypothetical protein PR001_g28167 [Phytophthora rubi]KAE8980466.1 hypothetical protein PR002_g24118 [Phytophthora rubi]KAE9276773.1 hypothetical protein PR003_g28973 [Phytophthora rubi]